MLMWLSAIRNGSSAGIEPCAMSVNMWPSDSTVIARRSTPARRAGSKG